jgi:cobalt-zinc-cadmium efflux system protein
MAHAHHHHETSGNIALAFWLNLGFTLFEIVGGLLTNSIAIVSDALHDAGDSLSLGMAWLLERYANKGSDWRYSYGYRRFSLLGAFINSAVLIVGSLFVLNEAVQRLKTPEPFDKGGLILIAVIGVVVNGFAALRLREGGSLNARALSWHMIEDVLGWAALLVMGIVSLFIDLPILDPLFSLGISAWIIYNAARNLWATAKVFLQAAPAGIDLSAIEGKLAAIAGVQSVHSLRLWSLDGEHHVLTAHLVADETATVQDFQRIKQGWQSAIGDLHLEDSALQIDLGDEDCNCHSPHATYEHAD